jgi:methionyl-tRNA formyltransferase
LRIVYLGTPEFAVPSLEILADNGYDIPAVITAPDKPGGRHGLMESAVKKAAVARGIPVLQPEKLKNPDFLATLKALKADLQVVVAFRMLPEAVWNMPPMGTLNLHGSLLPRYRGAAPINWAVINGETRTGMTTFLLKHEIDTGDILFQESIDIGENETVGELYERMRHQGAQLVLRTVKAIENGTAAPLPQSAEAATHAPKIFTETCKINFNQSTATVHNFVRGLSPHPGAWTLLDGKIVKIYRTLKSSTPSNGEAGIWSADTATKSLYVSTADAHVQILELQPEGKRRMAAADFLNGYQFSRET